MKLSCKKLSRSRQRVTDNVRRCILRARHYTKSVYNYQFCCARAHRPPTKLQVLVLGCHGVGKTTFCFNLCTPASSSHEKLFQPLSTDQKTELTGKRILTFNQRKKRFMSPVTLIKYVEIGGGKEEFMKEDVNHLLANSHAVIILLDLSVLPSHSIPILNSAISHKLLIHKPFLVVGSKLDLCTKFTMDTTTFIEDYGLMGTAARYKTRMLAMTSGKTTKKGEIWENVSWFIQQVLKNEREIKERMSADLEDLKAHDLSMSQGMKPRKLRRRSDFLLQKLLQDFKENEQEVSDASDEVLLQPVAASGSRVPVEKVKWPTCEEEAAEFQEGLVHEIHTYDDELRQKIVSSIDDEEVNQNFKVISVQADYEEVNQDFNSALAETEEQAKLMSEPGIKEVVIIQPEFTVSLPPASKGEGNQEFLVEPESAGIDEVNSSQEFKVISESAGIDEINSSQKFKVMPESAGVGEVNSSEQFMSELEAATADEAIFYQEFKVMAESAEVEVNSSEQLVSELESARAAEGSFSQEFKVMSESGDTKEVNPTSKNETAEELSKKIEEIFMTLQRNSAFCAWSMASQAEANQGNAEKKSEISDEISDSDSESSGDTEIEVDTNKCDSEEGGFGLEEEPLWVEPSWVEDLDEETDEIVNVFETHNFPVEEQEAEGVDLNANPLIKSKSLNDLSEVDSARNSLHKVPAMLNLLEIEEEGGVNFLSSANQVLQDPVYSYAPLELIELNLAGGPDLVSTPVGSDLTSIPIEDIDPDLSFTSAGERFAESLTPVGDGEPDKSSVTVNDHFSPTTPSSKDSPSPRYQSQLI